MTGPITCAQLQHAFVLAILLFQADVADAIVYPAGARAFAVKFHLADGAYLAPSISPRSGWARLARRWVGLVNRRGPSGRRRRCLLHARPEVLGLADITEIWCRRPRACLGLKPGHLLVHVLH